MKCFLIIGVLSTLFFVPTESERIRRNIFGGTVPPGAICLFNPCVQTQDFCKNQGNCSLNETTCLYKCICQEGFEGNRCEIEVIRTTETIISTSETGSGNRSTTDTPVVTTPKRQCFPGFVCQHGYCDTSMGFKCVCDFGWEGPFCEKMEKCPLSCEVGTECIISQNSYMCAKTTTTTETSGKATMNLTLSSTSTPLEITAPVSTTPKIEGQGENACSFNYTLRPLSERTCIPNFVCKYGQCEKDDDSNVIRLVCICDKGGVGALCENTCCRNCSDHGVCGKFSNGTEFCSCKKGYNGAFCENKITQSSTDTTPLEITSTVSSTPKIEGQDENACSFNYTLRPLSERTCIPNFVCKYGRCEKDDGSNAIRLVCICDKGGVGDLCEIKCCRNCSEYGVCRKFSNGTEFCSCKKGYNGAFCENKITQSSTDTTPLEITSPVSTTPKIDGQGEVRDSHENACSLNYTLRPLSERTCIPNFICQNGRCEKDESSSSISLKCICDKGGVGPMCENVCCRNCSEHGVCIKFSDETEFCSCKSGYNGPFCENKVTYSTSGINTTTTTASIQNTTSSRPQEQRVYPDGHVCSSNYTKKPAENRTCLSNFVCEYGVCEKEDYAKGISLHCECDDGAYGGLCQKKCCLLCSEHGICKKFNNGTEFCNCEHDYNGDFCENKIIYPTSSSVFEDSDWVYWIVGVCLSVLVILLMLAVVLPYYMWKNRVTLIMKIVHYFQPYEDDDERTWDAFISFKSSGADEDFVLRTLYPKLENEMGFTLCIHYKDFVPGEAIANNIINAVNNSRRTILILTPRYVQSEFTRFEYQVAQTEMLKRKHRIIPILLEDISEVSSTMDPNLKQIIKSVTYLEYPGTENDKKLNSFWKRLELSLPKKRSSEDKSTSEQSTSTYIKSSSEDSIDVSVISPSDFTKPDSTKESTEMTSFSDYKVVNTDDVKLNVNEQTKNITNGDLQQNIEKYMAMMENSQC